MRRPLVGLMTLGVLLVLAASPEKEGAAFQAGFGTGDPVHQWVTDEGLSFLGAGTLSEIKEAHKWQDCKDICPGGGNDDVPRAHFVRCLFAESGAYINEEYSRILGWFSEEPPDVWKAADDFGKLLHTAQDFYAHSNWVEIMAKRLPEERLPLYDSLLW